MSNSPDGPFNQTYQCRDCGSETGFRSRRRTLTERFILPLLLLKPVRCGECFRRDYRFVLTRVRERFSSGVRPMPVKNTASSNRNVA